ncbi:hypothetical protein L861_06255 [Litchfieldella anticariensis FP35 = DSM 16096]|uniref:Uncharacterized protein n=1 Tax=Litchfieldella anticariensis (strain DSM 16096 / CECT 5854 / CIP 108499 / LMG 22089 / FP35) TaxID=1121939 RepID=S2KF59_LITA3|nr:hypothetical protein [Halomonas anticariensis]EPC00540.1 hypothetical protein L861_06255 [Halomonas anticariensis FP35 = DSM 16096]
MRVVHVKAATERDACLARLCAEVYGRKAGLLPLVSFAGTRRVLFTQEAARLLALTDDQGVPQALALLVLDEAGTGMTLVLSCSLMGNREPERRLIGELAFKAPLRVEALDQDAEAFYLGCGITRWFAGRDGKRIGLGALHPVRHANELTETLDFDEQAVLRNLKHDAKGFEEEKQRFVNGLDDFPAHLS